MSAKPIQQIAEAKFAFAIDKLASAPAESLPEVAFAGRSNVGKSSLINCLLQRRNLVRTSSTPGCTRQINMFLAKLVGGPDLYMVDLPGFGYAQRSKQERQHWADLIESYIQSRSTLRLMVVIVDARRGPEEHEQMLVEFLEHARRDPPLSVVGVATKADKIPKSRASAISREVKAALAMPTILFSAETGLGREELWRTIRSAIR